MALGVYGSQHTPTFESGWTLGFPTQIQMKVWLAVAASILAVVQLLSALRMYGRIGSSQPSPQIARAHRWSGRIAVVLTLPIAYHCLWSLGFQSYSTRVLVHSLAGCAFYGAFVAKMLSLHIKAAPRWTLPLLGALTFTVFAAVVLTSAGWWFANGQPTY